MADRTVPETTDAEARERKVGLAARFPVRTGILILLVVAMAVSTLVAVLLERIAYRPLRGAPRLVPLITAIGASLFLQNTARGFFGSQTRGYRKPQVLQGTWNILGTDFPRIRVLVFLTAAVAVLLLTWFV